MSHAHIAFIGGGNMAKSIIGGLLNNAYPADHITVSDPNPAQCQSLIEMGVRVSSDNHSACAQADVVVLAVKPQVMQAVLTDLATLPKRGEALFLSIAAGLRIEAMVAWLGTDEAAFVRCMPNTPALVRCGASALYANHHCTEAQKALAHNLLSAVGIVEWVAREQDLDAITALSGSGPAYFFLMIEAMEGAAEQLGLPAHMCRNLAIQTALGAATMAQASEQTPAQLRQAVTSKGGTTAAALAAFEQAGFADVVAEAMRAAHQRSHTLSEELEGNIHG